VNELVQLVIPVLPAISPIQVQLLENIEKWRDPANAEPPAGGEQYGEPPRF